MRGLFLSMKRGWSGGGRVTLWGLAVWLLGWTAFGGAAVGPEIRSIERRGADLVIRATVPGGIARLVLEGSRQSDFRGWIPRAVERVKSGEPEVVFVIAGSGEVEMFRVRADATDPLPAAFYTGTTNFAEATSANGGGLTRIEDAVGGAVVPGTAPRVNESDGTARSVVESDIWVVEGDRMYFFNQYRGLQVLNVSNPDRPSLEGTFALPGAGEQMYLLNGRHAVLLAHDPCNAWGTQSESAVVIIDTGAQPLAEVARMPVKGRIVESRLVGTALYVATETWQAKPDGSGAWEAGTWVSSFDLAIPGKPEAKGTLWFPGSGNVVTATDRFLFVSIIDYSRSWPWRSDLQVVDIASPDGTMAPFAKIPLAGHVADKFKIDLLGDVLRVVVEATETQQSARWVTVLETYRLADPRAAGPVAYAKLDRLELARGERLFATRFDGERGYIVTFLRIDPLWVIDLSDPADLKVAGELEIPGWSTYIRPMGDRLLTMGIDNTNGWRVAVQLFDVANPAKPALLSKVPLGENSSWSEANQDEKAFGVFPEAGLLLVPLSSWSSTGGGAQGVQLIDFDRNGLKQRGFLESTTLVPRRATTRTDRVLAISGRELITANVVDRDRPAITGTLELAYPVERVLVSGGYLLEFQSGSIRVRPVGASETEARTHQVGDSPVLGATIQGSRLHLLQGQAAQVNWEQPVGSTEWLAKTNAGTLVATTWDLSALPELTAIGKAGMDIEDTWLAEARPHWPRPDVLVWATETSSWGVWWGAATDAVMVRGGGVIGPWMPWWYGGERRLFAVGLDATGVAQTLHRQSLSGEGNPAGAVVSGGTLLFSTRQIGHSEVVSTNVVVDRIWVSLGTVLVTNTPTDGSPGERVTKEETGEYRLVTNSYPVMRWWSTFELDVVDYAAGAGSPTRRPALPVGGQLAGVSHEGSLLYSTATREVPDGKGTQQVWLEAAAYDGVVTRLVDSVLIADYSLSETFAIATAGPAVFLARGGWDAKSVQRVERWQVSEAGRWTMLGSAGLGGSPSELRVFGDLLASRGGAGLEVFHVGAPGVLAPVPTLQTPGCYGGDLAKGAGDLATGLWLPLGEYGAVQLLEGR